MENELKAIKTYLLVKEEVLTAIKMLKDIVKNNDVYDVNEVRRRLNYLSIVCHETESEINFQMNLLNEIMSH